MSGRSGENPGTLVLVPFDRIKKVRAVMVIDAESWRDEAVRGTYRRRLFDLMAAEIAQRLAEFDKLEMVGEPSGEHVLRGSICVIVPKIVDGRLVDPWMDEPRPETQKKTAPPALGRPAGRSCKLGDASQSAGFPADIP